MQKILFFLLFSSFAYAQFLPKGFAPNEREKGFLKSLGITENPYQTCSPGIWNCLEQSGYKSGNEYFITWNDP